MQTPAPTSNTRGGLNHRRQRTLAISARDGIHPGAKQYVDPLRRDGGETHLPLAVLLAPPATVAELRPRTQARTHTQQTQTPAPTSNTRGSDCMRDRPTDGSAHIPSVRATALTPA